MWIFQVFFGLFFLKDKLVEPKTFTGVSCLNTEGLWKVWVKTEFWFLIQPPRKLMNFVGAAEKVEISSFIEFWFAFSKR